jgi:hypothetical protein
MAVNNNGNLLDSAGEVAIDFVWGNMPIQPNDVRPNTSTGRLDPALDNHIIALSGWGGYPQFTAGSAGEDVVGATDYVLVPSVLGLTTAEATDAMKDASLVPTTASAATNAAGVVTAVSRTAGSTTATITDSAHGFVTGNKVTISNTGEATVNGTFTVTRLTDNTFTITSTGTTALTLTGLSGAVVAVAGTIKSQSIAAGANNTAPGAAVTITPWATAS